MKKIRDESGAWIPATYKSKRYAQWKEKSKVEENCTADGEDDSDNDLEPQKRSQLHGMFKMYFIDYIIQFYYTEVIMLPVQANSSFWEYMRCRIFHLGVIYNSPTSFGQLSVLCIKILTTLLHLPNTVVE